ncbi:hypothetical protein [Pimelobacter simplex]|uniref:hypothetical protein n=1 Tax=Nocardioides simplex TaxID=2045 RepID=UPI00214F7FFF|nr:hypothetical protein [Pimelobacter simplex]UUW92476.1 hypothetical protein M0M43_13610 [Pimelobacter simplex]UUW96304.1 hypothetical protein M0M48_02245 [Pimelobacter simplex]
MRTSTKLIRLCAVVPAGVAGSFVAIMGLGFLPEAGLVFAFLGTLVVSIVLGCGWWEPPVARIFGFARGLRPGERALLEPTLRLTANLGLAPGQVLVRLTDLEGPPATQIGRRTVIVEPWLLRSLYERRLTTADAATAIGHAVARQRVGPARLDFAARLWAFPWTLLFVVIRQIARLFSWVPAGDLAWHLRIVLGVVALVQGFEPEGDPGLGVATAVLVAISYLAPAADRAWRSVVERDADRIMARVGLANSLINFVQWRYGPASLGRVHRIRSAAAEPKTDPASAAPTNMAKVGPPGGRQVLVHPPAVHQ